MKRLFLLRHGKSSWADENLRDFDRPLKKRGRRAAVAMGAAMAARGLVPDLILCSTAKRTRETLEALLPGLTERSGTSPGPAVRFEEDIYLASAKTLLENLAAWGAGATSVLVIGHNPGLHDCALHLAGDGPKGLLRRLNQGFPTAALAVLSCEHGLDAGRARLEALLLPRELD